MPLWMIRLAKAVFRLSYCPFRWLPKRHKLVLLSRQSDQPNLDFRLMMLELQRQDPAMQTVCCCKMIRKGLKNKMAYVGHLVVCMYHLATATHCVTDSYSIPLSVLSHKQLKTMQIWHALCAIKCFGHQTLDRAAGTDKKLALLMEMHRGYDIVLAPGERVAEHFSQGFATPREQICLLGMPRMDAILTPDQAAQQRLLAAYPALADKPNVLYTPTFRKGKAVDVSEVLAAFDFSHYNLVMKHHVLNQPTPSEEGARTQAILITDPSVSVFDLYQLCDCMITDYSATALEFSLLRKPLYFYVYDYDQYQKDPGLNIDVWAEFPPYTAKTFAPIMEMIRSNEYDLSLVDAFCKRYVSAPRDGSCTQKIVSVLLQEEDNRHTVSASI